MPLLTSMLSSFANIALRSPVRDDDAVDQLNHWASSGLLLALALATGAKQYVGDPIHCWVPAHFKKKAFQKYTDSYCWIHPMYNVPFEQQIPFEENDRFYNDVSFYRWVFIVFVCQAAMFKFPHMIWSELKCYSGLNVSKIVDMAWSTSMMTQDERDVKMSHIAVFMDRWLKTYSNYKYNVLTRFRDKFSGVMWCFGKRTGTYLSGLYMFTKLLYLANIIGQFFVVSAFLDLNFWKFGYYAMFVWSKDGRWQDLYHFPRIGYCDYKIRQMQNVQTQSVQCVLSINMFLEKMYLVLWFWMCLLLVLNTVNCFQWILRYASKERSESFLAKNLQLLGIDSRKERELFIRFVRKYLRTDGVFVLRIVADNTSEIMTLDLVKQMWKTFQESQVGGGALHKPTTPARSEASSDVGLGKSPSLGSLGGPASPSSPSAPTVHDDDDDLPPKPMD